MNGACCLQQCIATKNVLGICPVFLTEPPSALFNRQQFSSHLAATLVFQADYLDKLIS